MKEENRLQIRNSTAEFLIFTRQAGEDGIEVRVEEETVWLTQKLMAKLFEVTVPTINEHLSNLYSQSEIVKSSTIRNFRTVRKEGGREVARAVEFYNLDVIIAVGFRVNSARNLLAEIREIRASERRFYQKITDIYATAMDYQVDAGITQTFFATVQNKLHFAIHGHTAAEVILKRAESALRVGFRPAHQESTGRGQKEVMNEAKARAEHWS